MVRVGGGSGVVGALVKRLGIWENGRKLARTVVSEFAQGSVIVVDDDAGLEYLA
jgi:hypothetical protein